jgi:hypothetical protein
LIAKAQQNQEREMGRLVEKARFVDLPSIAIMVAIIGALTLAALL